MNDIASRLGLSGPVDISPAENSVETPPEDLMEVPVDIRFQNDGKWFRVDMRRYELTELLNTSPCRIEGMNVKEIAIRTDEGEECNLVWIFDAQTKYWRIE